ncbi:MAG: hypothetical protein ACT4QA_24445 [Panacagrimonas sp.]
MKPAPLPPTRSKTASKAFEALTAGGLRLLTVSRTACLRGAGLRARTADKLHAGIAGLHLAVALDADVKILAGLDGVVNEAVARSGFRVAL